MKWNFFQELYYTLTTQLEKQRQHYEEKIARLESNSQRELDEVLKRAKWAVAVIFIFFFILFFLLK